MKFRIIIFFLILFSSASIFAQDDDSLEPPDGRWYISPDFGLILGNITMIEVAPTIGYNLTPSFSAGVGGKYEYYRQLNYYTRAVEINTSLYSLRSFLRLVLVPDLGEVLPISHRFSLFSYVEYEALNLDEEYYGLLQSIDSERFWHHTILAGGGVSQQISKRSFMNLMVLWDMTNSSSSPYSNPILRFGLQFYFN